MVSLNAAKPLNKLVFDTLQRWLMFLVIMLQTDEHDIKYHLLTAQQAKSLNPGRYIVPPGDALKLLRAGHVVKLLAAANGSKAKEEVWVVITHRLNQNFTGMVYGKLVRTSDHGLAVRRPH